MDFPPGEARFSPQIKLLASVRSPPNRILLQNETKKKCQMEPLHTKKLLKEI